MFTEWCFVIQGPATHVDKTVSSVYPFSYLYSTWKEDKEKVSNIKDVIFNEKPASSGIGNLFYQQTTTLNGLIKAKNLGFKKCVKLRSDFILNNPIELIKIFNRKLNLFFWHDYNGGYFADYIMAGKVDILIELWKRTEGSYSFAEQMINENFSNMLLPQEDIKFFLYEINESNDIFWSKYNKYLSSYKIDKLALNYIP